MKVFSKLKLRVRSQRIAAETDEIGYGIIDELGEQRESLVRTRDRV